MGENSPGQGCSTTMVVGDEKKAATGLLFRYQRVLHALFSVNESGEEAWPLPSPSATTKARSSMPHVFANLRLVGTKPSRWFVSTNRKTRGKLRPSSATVLSVRWWCYGGEGGGVHDSLSISLLKLSSKECYGWNYLISGSRMKNISFSLYNFLSILL